MTTVRPAAVAGSFYPSAAQQLGALREAGVVTVDEGAGDDGCDRAASASGGQGVVEGVEDREAEGALGLGAAPVERHRRDDVRGELVLDQQVAHLGAVAVGDDDLVPGGDEIGHALHGAGDGGALGLRGG